MLRRAVWPKKFDFEVIENTSSVDVSSAGAASFMAREEFLSISD